MMANSARTDTSFNNLTDLFLSGRVSPYTTAEVVIAVIVTGSLSLVTIIGNILVIISIKVNRHLQTINNYFIFSLACADLIIGMSMNLFTIYTLIGYWPFGPVICDLWLAVDYVVSNASSMSLLVISFDRYFCVTKPLSYPARRTAKMAGMMIGVVWVVSFILWAPAILFWQFIVGERTVTEDECYIQFFSNPAVTFGTAIAAFYLPVLIMMILYVQISRASKSRIMEDKKVPELSEGAVSDGVAKGKIMELNSSSIPNIPHALPHTKMQGDKIIGEAIIGNSGQEEEEFHNETTSHSVVPSNQKQKGTIQEGTTIFATQSCFQMDNTRLSCLQIASQSHINDHCGTTARKVPGIGNKSRHDRETSPRSRTITMANISTKKKKGAASREKKVTRTVLAILLAFIITWAPYNVMVLIDTFCMTCIPNTVWIIGYWIFYINSTVNPACYALCNPTFKKTFKQLLLCQYKNIGAAR